MNLQDLRRRVCGLHDKNGATGPTWINPKEAIYLLDTIDSMQSRLESLEKDAARWKWFSENGENQDHDDIVRYLNSYVVTKQYLDHRIDAAMQANKGE